MQMRNGCSRVLTITLVGLVTVGLVVGVSAAWAAEPTVQGQVMTRDLQELQDDVNALRSQAAELGEADSRRERIEDAVDELDDEIAYLRVKLRREDAISYGEIDDLRRRASALRRDLEESPRQLPEDVTVPVGTEIDVRLQSSLDSDTAQVEDRFYATVVDDLVLSGRTVIPAGSEARGVVSAVDRSSRTDRSASLTLTFDQVTVEERTYPARLTLTEAQDRGIRDELDRIGVGAAVGGVIGGLIGGGRGALTGILIGAGGTVAATEGEDVKLPAGTVLRVRFDSSVTIIGTDQ